MVNTSADDVDSMKDRQPIVLPEQGQEMREDAPRPQPPAPAAWPRTPEPHPLPRAPETHPLSGHEHLGLVAPQKSLPVVPAPQEAEAAGNTLYVDVDQQLLGESAGGNSLSDVPLPDAPLNESLPDSLVGDKWTSPHIPKKLMVVVFGSG